MEIELGMLVRTKYGINKLYSINNNATKWKYYLLSNNQSYDENGAYDVIRCCEEEIEKASHNIADVIEIGDYVNGGQVREKTKEFIRISGGEYLWQFLKKEEEIKSVVTKEQFKNMEYEVK